MKPRVSILLPNYNNAAYLSECIESILAQTYTDFVLLFIDDGSTDNSVQIVEDYNDPRFKVIIKEQNSGIVDTLNVGLEHLQTEFMIRLDGDDYMTNDRIQILVDYLDNNPEIDICGSSLQMFGTHNQTVHYEPDSTLNKATMIFNHSVGHATLIFRSYLFKDKGFRYKNEFKYLEDYHLLFDMIRDVSFTTIDKVLYFYRQTGEHFPQQVPPNRVQTSIDFYHFILKNLDDSEEWIPEVHFQLAKLTEITFPYKVFEKHVYRVIDANLKSKIFPHQEMKELVLKGLKRMQFRMIDQGSFTLKDVLTKPNLYRYYLKSKLKRS